MSRRLFLELAVIVGVGAFAFVKIAPRWNGFFSPLKPAAEEPPPPADVRAAPPDAALPVPAAKPGAPKAAGTQPAMMIVPENQRDAAGKSDDAGDLSLRGSAAPQVFQHPAIPADSLALAKEAPTSGARLQPAWLTRLEALDPRGVVGLVAGVFLLLYMLGAAALRKGPGGKGLTHD